MMVSSLPGESCQLTWTASACLSLALADVCFRSYASWDGSVQLHAKCYLGFAECVKGTCATPVVSTTPAGCRDKKPAHKCAKKAKKKKCSRRKVRKKCARTCNSCAEGTPSRQLASINVNTHFYSNIYIVVASFAVAPRGSHIHMHMHTYTYIYTYIACIHERAIDAASLAVALGGSHSACIILPACSLLLACILPIAYIPCTHWHVPRLLRRSLSAHSTHSTHCSPTTRRSF